MFQTHIQTPDFVRDGFEEALIVGALDHRRPILGICRGMQLLNVVRGGTLNRDLAGFYAETPQLRSVLPVKEVILMPETRLAEIMDADSIQVNALHNQAVDTLGQSMRICGREATGVIQAIEATDLWCIGVQWHPEYLPHKAVQRSLFRALVREANRSSGEVI